MMGIDQSGIVADTARMPELDTARLIASLERFGAALPVLLEGVTPEEARWKPADDAWSILEVVRHLGDEEVEDFRTRAESTLRDPANDWPPIDPVGWATERRYNEGQLEEAVLRFVQERRRSIAWLRTLPNPDWSRTKTHPKLGSMSAGDLLASWTAHDALHLRQIAKRLYQLVGRHAPSQQFGYAGEW